VQRTLAFRDPIQLDSGLGEQPDAGIALGQIGHPFPQLKALTLKLSEEFLTKIPAGAKAGRSSDGRSLRNCSNFDRKLTNCSGNDQTKRANSSISLCGALNQIIRTNINNDAWQSDCNSKRRYQGTYLHRA
jgi:hypothetical protein